MAEENLTPQPLVEYTVQTQRELSSNQQLLTTILQRQDDRLNNQDEEIKLLRQLLQNHEERLQRFDETIGVMQGQIRILLERLLGNT